MGACNSWLWLGHLDLQTGSQKRFGAACAVRKPLFRTAQGARWSLIALQTLLYHLTCTLIALVLLCLALLLLLLSCVYGLRGAQHRAMAAHPPPGQQAALQLVQSLIWIEQQAQQWLGGRAVAAVRSWLVALRDEAVRVHGMHPLVLDMPDGFVCASTRTPPDGRSYPQISQRAHQHTGVRAVLGGALAVATQALTACFTWLSSLTDGGGSSSGGSRSGDARAAGQKGSGWWEAVGADKVDKENLVLTCLLGALAGVLWLHVRQQGQAARRGLQQQMEAQMGDPRPGPEGVVGEGGVAAGGDALQLPAAVPQTQGRPSPLMRRNVQPPQPQQG